MSLIKLIISFVCFAQSIQLTVSLPLIHEDRDFAPFYGNEFDGVGDISLYPIHHVYPNDDVEGSSLVLYKEVPIEPSYFTYPIPEVTKTGRAGGILDNIVMEAINMFAPIPVKKTFNDTFAALEKQIKINDKEMKKEKRKEYNSQFKKKRKPVKDDDDEDPNGNNSSDKEDEEDDEDNDEDEEEVDDDEVDAELDDEFADEDKDEVSEFVDWVKDLIVENIQDDPNANLEGWDQQDFNQLDQFNQEHETTVPTTRQLDLVDPYLENTEDYWDWNTHGPQIPYSVASYPYPEIQDYQRHFSPRSGEERDAESDENVFAFESGNPNYRSNDGHGDEYYTYFSPIY